MFLETICIEEGKIRSLEAHLKRMNDTCRAFGMEAPSFPDLLRMLPMALRREKTKCRVVYDDCIREITFDKYVPRNIQTLRIVDGGNADYAYKYADRTALQKLAAEKGKADEILIVKDGFITDTSFSNVVFENEHGLFTPDTYLLNGTMRQQLLAEHIVKERRIRMTDISQYHTAYLVNAMLDMENAIAIDCRNIFLS